MSNNTDELYSMNKIILDSGINHELLSENHKSIGSELMCSICLEIVLNPVMCSQCENLFCKPCIDQLLIKSSKCPNLCVFIEKEKNIMLKKLLNRIEFKCYYYKNGCIEIIPYSEFIKHMNDCEFANFECNSCSFIGIKKIIIEHVEICPFREFECKLCKLMIARKDLEQHIKKCENIIVSCRYCSSEIIHKYLEEHIERCDFVEICCKECEQLIKRMNYASHDKINCLTSQVSYWKERCVELEKEKIELENKVKDSEKMNKNIVNLSTKLLENKSNNVYNNSMYFDVVDLNLNNDEPVENLYTANSVKILNGLSGLVYAIIDLSQYIENLAACGNYSCILLFDSFTCEKIAYLEGHTSYIWSLVHLINYNISYIASGSQDNTIRIWDLIPQTCVRTLSGHLNWVTTVTQLNMNSSYLMSASYDHTIRIWNIETGDTVKQINNIFGKSCLNAHYVKSSYILHGSSGNNIIVYDYETDTIKFTLRGHNNLINCFINLGEYNFNYIASGSDDKTIRVWDLSTGMLVKTFTGHSQCITHLSHLHHYDNSIIFSGSDDHTIRLWSLITFDCKAVIKIHFSWVKSMLHLPRNPEYFLSHGDTGVIKLSKLEFNFV